MTFYRSFLVAVVVALCGLLVIQVYWFSNAYRLEEKQFDETVNLTLRKAANSILNENGNLSSAIAPVSKTSSNSFFVEINSFIEYPMLDSLLKAEFAAQQVSIPFTLVIYNVNDDGEILLGNFYDKSPNTGTSAQCVGREQETAQMNFAVTFPSRASNILGAVDLWVFSAGTFLLIIVFFGFILVDLIRQRKLMEVKNDFINNMTHELQTPIANISIASEVLRANNSWSPDKREKYLEIIHQENQRLKNHVDQVLQTAMADRDGLILIKNEVNLHELIEEVINNFQIRIQSRAGSLKSLLKAEACSIFGDRFHLTNIFYNLLDNADKYSPLNPEIVVMTENSGSGLLVSFIDHGIGIQKESKHQIFDKFFRGSSGNVHDVKGFGLGLTYVKKIVQAHEGSIHVSSETKGSRFDLFFPAVK